MFPLQVVLVVAVKYWEGMERHTSYKGQQLARVLTSAGQDGVTYIQPQADYRCKWFTCFLQTLIEKPISSLIQPSMGPAA